MPLSFVLFHVRYPRNMKLYCRVSWKEKQFEKRSPTENNENQEHFEQKRLELATSQSNSCDIAAHTFYRVLISP